MRKITLIGILFILVGFQSFQAQIRTYISHRIDALGIEIQVSDGNYRFSSPDPHIVETTFIPDGDKPLITSHAVILPPLKNGLNITEKENLIQLSTAKITVKIQLSPFKIDYLSGSEVVLSEKNGYSKTTTHERLDFSIQPEDVLYGGGARALGMNRRGNRLTLYNRAHYGYEERSELMNFCIPIVISSRKFMVHFDNPETGFLDLDSEKNNTIAFETTGGNKTFQLIVGADFDEILEAYTRLTGTQPLPPRWAFGNFASRFGYHSEEETRNVVNRFAADSIPLDAVILDLYWFGKEIQGTMGNLAFHRDSFPTAEKMIADFKQKNIQTILITEPFILSTSNRWNEAVSKDILAKDSLGKPFRYDFYFGNTGLIDIYSRNGNQWFWNIYHDLMRKGVTGFWGDLGEPEVHPEQLIHAVGKATKVHNIYGHDWARLIQEGYQKHAPTQRPFILMRAGYSGSQRFGMIPWSGDVNRTWGGLKPQPEISLQMGMQGIGYMHSDLGGFAGANDDPELYTRWLQYGVFQPIFRPHAQEDVPAEPVFKDTKTKQLAKTAIELRYALLPYNYTIAYQNSKTGQPLMRPLFFEEPTNTTLYEYSKSYLWGSDFLISPVLESKKTYQEIYFPATGNWFDFYTEEWIQGGTTKSVNLSIENIPTFVREGSFIPMRHGMMNTSEMNSDSVEIHFYYSKNLVESSGVYFNDDGNTSQSYENYSANETHFTFQKRKKTGIISIEKNSIGKIYLKSSFDFYMHQVDKKPKHIKINGKKIKFNYIEKTKILHFKAHSTYSSEEIKINW